MSNTASSCTQSPDPAPSCRLRLNGTTAEQNLLADLITESIDIHGQDIYYIPRTLVKEDTLFNEDTMSEFNGAYAIRAYCNTNDGWEGQGDLLSKFGIRIEDKTTFVVSRRRFASNVDGTPEVGFQVTGLMNYQGQATVGLNTVSVGLGNPAWGPAIQANPSNHEIVFNGGFTATIVTATGTATPGAQWTFTGIWPANATGAPLTIRSKDYEPAFIGADLIVDGRPNEGDLIWAPWASNLFEITFVEHEKPFYQLGKGYVWEMKCELFQYSHEDLNTGIDAVDDIEDEDSYSLDITFPSGGTGNYTVGESVYGTSNDASIAYTHSDWTLGFSVWAPGDGYDPLDPPSITFSAPPSGGTQATGTVQVNSAGQVTGVTLNPGSGYTSAPTFTLEPSPARVYGEVVSWNPTTRLLRLNNLTGELKDNEVIKGVTSGTSRTINVLDSYNMGEIEGAQNKYFEVKGDLILDFSESNPFGEYGDMGDRF
jgi:hypothetical protein